MLRGGRPAGPVAGSGVATRVYPAVQVTGANPLHKLAFGSLLFYLFVLHSRVLDLTLSFLHIPIISLYLAVLAALLGGGLFRSFSNRVGILLLALSGWMILCVPFATWPGGSVQTVKDWLKGMLVFLVIAGLISTFEQLRRTIHLLAYSLLVLALLALVFGDMRTGRLILDRGRFTNPNDLAQILLMGLPFWWYVATNRTLSAPRRLGAWLAMVPILYAITKTGSRGALIAAGAVALVLFWKSPPTQKVVMLMGVCGLIFCAAVFLPAATRARYFTFFEKDDTSPFTSRMKSNMESSAVSSSYGRWHLFKDSVVLTLLHPVFGVGPGEFDIAQDNYSWAVRKHKGDWQVTHNTFTEWSSENGIPALIFYSLALYYAFKFSRVPRQAVTRKLTQYRDVATVSLCLRLSLLSYVISSWFGCFAYQTQFLVLAGLAVAFSKTVNPVLAETEPLRFEVQRAPVARRSPAARRFPKPVGAA